MSRISAGTTTATGLVQTSDTTGNLELQTNNGTTAVTFDTSQNASFAGDISVQGGNYLSSQPSFRNLIINGDMRINQRGNTTGVNGSGYFGPDRWNTEETGLGTYNVEQSTDVPTGQGFSHSLKISLATTDTLDAGDFIRIAQRIEGQNLQQLKFGTSSAESLTMSFWVKSNLTGTYSLGMQVIASPTNQIIGSTYTIDSANTWEKKTITIPGNTSKSIVNDNTLGFRPYWWLVAGSNYTGTSNTSWADQVTSAFATGHTVDFNSSTSNYINITGVQLEVGSQATPFEHKPYDVELARCQRYFQSFGGNNVAETVGQGTSFSTTNTYVLIHLLQTMRSVPSLGYSAVGDWRLHYPGVTGQEATAMAIATNDSNNTKVIVNTTTATDANMGGGKCIQLTADSTISARLTFSAEL